MEGERNPTPYLRSKFNEGGARVSHDGHLAVLYLGCHWKGRDLRSILSFPGRRVPRDECRRPSHRLVEGLQGDHRPWTRQCVWSVPVSTDPTFEAGIPRLLFRSNFVYLTPTPDGDRFLGLMQAREMEPMTITVDLNWLAEMGR